jgi:hypothetical protein
VRKSSESKGTALAETVAYVTGSGPFYIVELEKLYKTRLKELGGAVPDMYTSCFQEHILSESRYNNYNNREELHDRLEGSDGDVNRLLAPARAAAKNLAKKLKKRRDQKLRALTGITCRNHIQTIKKNKGKTRWPCTTHRPQGQ